MIKGITNFKKFTSMGIALMVSMLSVCLYSSYTMASNTTRSYTYYNANGEVLGYYDIEPLSAPNNNARNTINGIDDRFIDWSKSGVVEILAGGELSTGFVIDNHMIATVAHGVFNEESQECSAISKILLFNSDGSIALEATPVQIHIPNVYGLENPTSNNLNPNHDYAFITIEEDLRSYACFSLAVPFDSFNGDVSATGFPNHVNGEYWVNNGVNNHNMYTSNGQVTEMLDKVIYHTAYLSPGNSGGPLYVTESRNGHTYYSVIGINSGVGGSINTSTRITTDLLHFFYNNPELQRQEAQSNS